MVNVEFGYLDPVIGEHTPILPMTKVLPEWYKRLPPYAPGASKCPIERLLNLDNNVDLTTIKSCPPVYDYLTSGYVIPWSYETLFKVQTNEDGTRGFKYYSANKEYISFHHIQQFPEVKSYFFKVNSPWTIKTPKGYSCLFFQSFFHMEKRYAMLPAIVDTDKYHQPNLVGYMLEDEFTIKPNEPLIFVMPFRREHFKSKIVRRELDNYTAFFGTKRMPGAHSLYTQHSYKILSWVKKLFQ